MVSFSGVLKHTTKLTMSSKAAKMVLTMRMFTSRRALEVLMASMGSRVTASETPVVMPMITS